MTTRHTISDSNRRSQPDPTNLWSALGVANPVGVDTIRAIRQGFRPKVLDRLAAKLILPRSELLRAIRLAPTTFTRRQKQGRLTHRESDRLYRLVAAYEEALRLFEGNIDATSRWMTEAAPALGGETPLQYLDTEAGADALRSLIGRLEHGVVT